MTFPKCKSPICTNFTKHPPFFYYNEINTNNELKLPIKKSFFPFHLGERNDVDF